MKKKLSACFVFLNSRSLFIAIINLGAQTRCNDVNFDLNQLRDRYVKYPTNFYFSGLHCLYFGCFKQLFIYIY